MAEKGNSLQILSSGAFHEPSHVNVKFSSPRITWVQEIWEKLVGLQVPYTLILSTV